MTPCRLCESVVQLRTWEIPETMFRLGSNYEYSECGNCGSLTLQTLVVDHPLYPENYYSLSASPHEIFSSHIKSVSAALLAQLALAQASTLLRICRVLAPIKEMRTLATVLLAVSRSVPRRPNVSILDVGSGNGTLPYILGLAKANAVGVDPNTNCEWQNEQSSNSRMSLDAVNDRFDLVMFNHSLEHMHDPVTALKAARSLLARDGRILVRVPYLDCIAWQQFREHWYQLDAPRHTFIASYCGIVNLLKFAELRLVSTYCDSSAAQFYLSSTIQSGLSQMDESVNYLRYRRDSSGIIMRITNLLRTTRLNRAERGDQIVLVLEPS
jgi:SAM-dependent methyltransferase